MDALLARNEQLEGELSKLREEHEKRRALAEHYMEVNSRLAEQVEAERNESGVLQERLTEVSDAYATITQQLVEARTEHGLAKALMRERDQLVRAVLEATGSEIEWDDAGFGWIEYRGQRMVISKREFKNATDEKAALDLASRTGGPSWHHAHCPNGHLVNFQAMRTNGREEPYRRMKCPVCAASVENPHHRDSVASAGPPLIDPDTPLRVDPITRSDPHTIVQHHGKAPEGACATLLDEVWDPERSATEIIDSEGGVVEAVSYLMHHSLAEGIFTTWWTCEDCLMEFEAPDDAAHHCAHTDHRLFEVKRKSGGIMMAGRAMHASDDGGYYLDASDPNLDQDSYREWLRRELRAMARARENRLAKGRN